MSLPNHRDILPSPTKIYKYNDGSLVEQSSSDPSKWNARRVDGSFVTYEKCFDIEGSPVFSQRFDSAEMAALALAEYGEGPAFVSSDRSGWTKNPKCIEDITYDGKISRILTFDSSRSGVLYLDFNKNGLDMRVFVTEEGNLVAIRTKHHPIKDEPFVANRQVMPKINGKGFRCECCNANVFTEYLPYKYQCNSCRTQYTGEPEVNIDNTEVFRNLVNKLKRLEPVLERYLAFCNCNGLLWNSESWTKELAAAEKALNE